MRMRKSRVLEKLRRGETVITAKLNISDAKVAEIAACSGFDCLWVCREHVPADYSDLQEVILAGKAYDTDVMCRVERGSYSDYIRPLELDAAGIMVPHVTSADDARKIVRTTRFHPLGRRPADGGNADGKYCMIPLPEYMKQANDQRFVALQIEDPEALDELDAIAAVDGYDILFYGPGDMSHGMGIPGEFNHPKVLEARTRIAEAARKHGKFAGTLANSENFQELTDSGYQFLNITADVCLLTAGFADALRPITTRKSRSGNYFS